MKLTLFLLPPIMATMIWVMSHFYSFIHISSSPQCYIRVGIEAGAVSVEAFGPGIRPSSVPETRFSRRMSYEFWKANLGPEFEEGSKKSDYSVARTALGSFRAAAKYTSYAKWIQFTLPIWLLASLAAAPLMILIVGRKDPPVTPTPFQNNTQ